MSHCERCGAVNQSQGRFCVSCGAPLAQPNPAQAPAPQPQAQPGPPAPQHAPVPGYAPPGPPQQQYGAPPQPQYGAPHQQHYAPPPAGPAPYAQPPAHDPNPFAETAGPSGQHEQDAARQAALGHPPAPGGYPGATSRPPAGYSADHHGQGYSPAGAAPAPYPGAPPLPSTAQMPGTSQDPETLPEGSPRILTGFLISYETDALGKFWPIYQGRTLLGREGGGPVDIPIPHPTTSSRHAVVYSAARPGRIKIEDAGSTNGTFVNDNRLQTGQRHELKDGDGLRFGLYSAVIKII